MLGWLGRQRTHAIPALVLVGIAVPPLGAALKPYVAEAVTGLLCIAFLRIDVHALRAHLRRPGIVVAASAWTSLAIPALFAAATLAFGPGDAAPEVHLGIMLQALASPMMAAPAFAAMMGLDATLVLSTLMLSTAIVPFSAAMFASLVDLDVPLSPTALGARLLAIVAIAAIAGLILRRLSGPARIARYRDEIDGVNILLLLVFVAAIMSDLGIRFLAEPVGMILLTALAFAVYLAILAVTLLVFTPVGRQPALAVALVTSQRNMGLMVAATDGILPPLTWLYIAVSQFPIHLAAQILLPLSRALKRFD
ncbi:MAG: Na+-dependent transporter [Gammaproteobacteria bacterium]|nr:Na+-dependent transporter [Gammaproteobacteria bacterium]